MWKRFPHELKKLCTPAHVVLALGRGRWRLMREAKSSVPGCWDACGEDAAPVDVEEA
jgi:hypothetical protein